MADSSQRIRELRLGAIATPRDAQIALRDIEERINALVRAYVPQDLEELAWDSIIDKPDTFPPSEHNHDDLYFRQAQIEELLAEKAALEHTHPFSALEGQLAAAQLPTGGEWNLTSPLVINGAVTINGPLTAPAVSVLSSFGATFDGQIAPPAAGASGYAIVPWSGTIEEWRLVANAPGSIQLDILRSGASIIGPGFRPTLVAAQRNSHVPTDWTSLAVTIDDEFEIRVVSASGGLTRAHLFVQVRRT